MSLFGNYRVYFLSLAAALTAQTICGYIHENGIALLILVADKIGAGWTAKANDRPMEVRDVTSQAQ